MATKFIFFGVAIIFFVYIQYLTLMQKRQKNFFEKNKIKYFLFQIKSVTLQTEKGVLCRFDTILERKILKNNIIIKN